MRISPVARERRHTLAFLDGTVTIDGTEAADVLAEIEEGLESFKGSGVQGA
ncbi:MULTISPECIES: hypothetical protein [unclassified Streptomyces]|uniref:hypothetical protein n=1 Tax=unclassified Streptomyces TaxID=2593676 RepID=UPI0033DD7B5D